MAKKYCNKCKKDVTPKKGKCPDCGMVFDVKLKEDAIPINVVNGEKSKDEKDMYLPISGLSRLLGIIMIFWAFAYLLYGKVFTVAILMFIISFLLFAVGSISDQLNDMRYELNKLKNKVKKKK